MNLSTMESVRIVTLIIESIILIIVIWALTRKKSVPVFRIIYIGDNCFDLPKYMPDPRVGEIVYHGELSCKVTSVSYHIPGEGEYFQLSVRTKSIT